MSMRDREIPIVRTLDDVGPVARVWVIAQTMGRSARRRDVLRACKDAGINAHTASTQYQLWKYAQRQARVARALPKRVKARLVREAHADARA